MKITYIKYLTVLVLGLILVSCGGSDTGGDDTPPVDPPAVIPAPAASTLVFPDNNTECNTGEILNDTQSLVTFQWTVSANTTNYEVNVKNLETNSTVKRTTTVNELGISIARGTPFEWFVISRATGTDETATSPTWLFYNEGIGIENYAPFPAVALNPKPGVTIPSSSITLTWSGIDVDDDITGYDIFLDTEEVPELLLGSTTNASFENVSVTAGLTCYWRIISKDSAGNSSTSQVFQFRVN